jgi:hypothetical protein
MPKWGNFDFSEFERMRDRFQKALDGQIIEQFIRDFTMEIAMRAIRKIKKRSPVGNGQLRRMWQVGKVEQQGDAYNIEIFNNLDYASFVEFGFRAHWVPGYWQGNMFVYVKNYKPPEGQPGGMQVGPRNGWVEGRFMMAISMKEIEQELPQYLAKRQVKLLNDLMNGRTGP